MGRGRGRAKEVLGCRLVAAAAVVLLGPAWEASAAAAVCAASCKRTASAVAVKGVCRAAEAGQPEKLHYHLGINLVWCTTQGTDATHTYICSS